MLQNDIYAILRTFAEICQKNDHFDIGDFFHKIDTFSENYNLSKTVSVVKIG
jgi:hypothetical protein